MSRDVLSDPGEGPLEQPPAEDAVGRLRAPLVRHLVPRVLPLVFRFGQGEKKKKKSWFPGRKLPRADAPRGRSGARGGGGLGLPPVRGRRCPPSGPAQRPLPGRALLTRPRLVGATSRRASAPPLVTRPARTPAAQRSRLPPALPRVTCPPRPRNRSGQCLSASGRPARRSVPDRRLLARRTRSMHAAVTGFLG